MSSTKTKMQQAVDVGQSIWLDYILRSYTQSGKLRALIDRGLRGETSNPSIFEKAIVDSKDYVEVLDDPKSADMEAGKVFERLATEDVQAAADQFRRVYDAANGTDGLVSYEVEPSLSNNTQRTAS